MPKYKVTYTFEVEVEAPNESIATINADYVLDNDENEPYMWDYCTKRESIEIHPEIHPNVKYFSPNIVNGSEEDFKLKQALAEGYKYKGIELCGAHSRARYEK